MIKILTEEFLNNVSLNYDKTAQKFLHKHRYEWFNFLNKVLKYVYEPKNRYYTVVNGGIKKTGVFTENGEWHPIINKINTNYSVIGKIIKEAGIDPNKDSEYIFMMLKRWFRENGNYKSLVSEDGELYRRIVYPTIYRTSNSGERREKNTEILLKDCPLFNGLKLKQIGGAGVLDDMLRGVDMIAYKNDVNEPVYTIQIKPFTNVVEGDYVYFINGVGNAKKYMTNFIVFTNGNKILVVSSSDANPKIGSYHVRKSGILWSKGVDTLNESIDIIRNMLKKV